MRSVIILFLAVVPAFTVPLALAGGAAAAPTSSRDTPASSEAAPPADGAISAVVRVGCPASNTFGTGFRHRSGKVLTTFGLVGGCQEVVLISPGGAIVNGTVVARDAELDLALVEPRLPIEAQPLRLSRRSPPEVGASVAILGFPAGYDGSLALVTGGHVSGSQTARMASGRLAQHLVVAASLNAGHSGGPVVDTAAGEVIGVIISSLPQLSDAAVAAVRALHAQQAHTTYVMQRPDGATFNVTLGQIVATVFNELRQQMQVVVGIALPAADVCAFLAAHEVEP